MAAAMAGEGTLAWPLTGQFRQHKYGQKLFSVTLNEAGVTVTSDGVKQVIKVTDLVGCVCQQKQKQQQGSSAFFTLLAYPLTERKKRVRVALCFEVAEKKSFKENLEVANAWRKAVYHAVRTYGKQAEGRKERRVGRFPLSAPVHASLTCIVLRTPGRARLALRFNALNV